MIVYDLGCENEHRFEGWFTSGDDFEQQRKEKRLSCPLCGSDKVVRLPHAPHISTGGREAAPKTPDASQQYANFGTEFLARLVDHIIETTEDVGAAFPEEARKIHYREAPERRIRGTASVQEIDELKEEGIEVAALPIPPYRIGKSH